MSQRMPVEIRSDNKGGVIAACTECKHETQSKGETDRSRRRCLALMREQCPEGKEYFYVDADADDDD